ncbi:MAG: FG-GAP-like repeat-containing protein, partial [Thermoleophilaceae bacterium]
TLRLRSVDSRGNRGEDRGYFHVLGNQGLQRRFPKRLGSSGESSPVLANLTRDPGKEIVVATSDGRVRAWTGGGRRLRGWPRSMKWLARSGFASRRIGALRPGILATPAVGDIAGSQRPEVVVAGLDGRVYAWTARGRRIKGFPVRIDPLEPAARGELDRAIYASPALADLNGDGKLDIVVGASDQKVYAWDGRGRRLPGWPVLARDGKRAKILSSPAIGDLDGDGRPDVVEGTGEGYGSTPETSGRVYAWHANGKPLPGWPVKPPALAADSIPIAGEGVPDSPDLADVDGDGRDEVAVATFTGQPELYRGDGTRIAGPGGSANHFQDASGIALGANGAFGRTTPGGPLRFFSGLVDARLALAQSMPASRVPFDHLLGGWDARSGAPLPAFPVKVEGWTILTAPAIADVDGDGESEVIQGGSGNVLHAFREDGSEPSGWPKHPGGWLLASPAVGNVDRDRAREVVAVTRDGWLYVWQTSARAGAPADWPSFRHDSRNSGRFGP